MRAHTGIQANMYDKRPPYSSSLPPHTRTRTYTQFGGCRCVCVLAEAAMCSACAPIVELFSHSSTPLLLLFLPDLRAAPIMHPAHATLCYIFSLFFCFSGWWWFPWTESANGCPYPSSSFTPHRPPVKGILPPLLCLFIVLFLLSPPLFAGRLGTCVFACTLESCGL